MEEGEAGHQHPDRLKLAEKIGAVAIDDSTGDAVEKVLASTRASCTRQRVGGQRVAW